MGKGEHEDHHVGHSEDATIHPVMATEVRSTTLLAKSRNLNGVRYGLLWRSDPTYLVTSLLDMLDVDKIG